VVLGYEGDDLGLGAAASSQFCAEARVVAAEIERVQEEAMRVVLAQ
jgi:hypothetical protein